MIHTGRENANVLNCPAAVNHLRAFNSDYAGGITYSGEIESLDRDPGIATLNPGINNPTLK